jgi:carboxymethylenebutenolidase
MIEHDVLVTTRHAAMPAFTACPEGTGRVPAVIFFVDAWGMREELKNMARRIAKQGYFCIVADLYYRYGTIRFDLTRRHDGMAAVMRAAYHNLTDDNVKDDTAAMLGYLAAHPQVRSGPVGTVGYCMGGRFVTTTARQFPDQIVAGVSICGTRLVTDQPDSPHLHLSGIKANLYFGFGGNDHTTPADYLARFQSALDASGLAFGMDIFAGAEHGYCFAERHTYEAGASEASWSKMFDLYSRTLGAPHV